ncbi:PLP-dependent aminotransferase family protein [Pseudomonas asplenii]|uniref:aminotransferase-like domain-containing protein n=1 Tax=Pseudomonas asplenii TaxID=53407 RepID=UPI000375E16F|nr:PLP-dependent aminotransferase family protein [Pseudomonas fuscovaginae]
MYSSRSQRASQFGAFDYSATKQVINFAIGLPDPQTFAGVPLPASPLPDNGVGLADLLQYTDSLGLPELRQSIARRHEVAVEQVQVTAGASQALTLLADLLIDPGDIVLTEDPGYLGALRIFSVAGAKIIQLGMDRDGVNLDELAHALKNASGKVALYYTSPVFHNPTGCCFSIERMQAVAQLLSLHQVPLIQDLVYRELPYQAVRPEVLPAGQGVINIHSCSKIAGAGLRVGWVLAEPGVIQGLAQLKLDGGVSPLVSNLVLSLLHNEAFDSHIEDLREHYRTRRDLMASLLKSCTFCVQDYLVPTGGFSFWVRIADDVEPAALIDKARELGNVRLSNGIHNGPQSRRNVRLCFSYLSPAQMRQGLQIIEEAYRSLRP